ncbi:MAG: rod shape-determining protein MreC [Patescibacteria group bacterium]
MTMIMQRHSPRSNPLVFHLGFVVLCVVVAAGLIFNAAFFRFVSSITLFFNTTPSEYVLLPRSVLASRIVDLEVELARIRYQSLLVAPLIEDNARLQALVDLTPNDVVGVGRVISAPPRTLYDTLLVSLSEGADVQVGDVVLFEEILLGEVIAREDTLALVSLYSSGGTKSDVRVGSPSAIVVMEGQGGGAFTFEVPRSVFLAPGDVVLNTRFGVHPLAIVESVVVDPDETVSTVYARSPVSFSDIVYVTFLRSLGTL